MKKFGKLSHSSWTTLFLVEHHCFVTEVDTVNNKTLDSPKLNTVSNSILYNTVPVYKI